MAAVAIGGVGAATADDLVPVDDATQPYDLVGDPTPAASQERVSAIDANRQTHIAECMAAAGHQYRALDLDAMGGQVATPEALGLDENTFLRRYGYGYTAWFDPTLSARHTIADPNQAIVAALPAAERAGYEAALTACWDEAALVYPDPGAVPTAVADELDDLVEGDQRTVAATDTWSDCMAARGFAYADRDAVFADLEARMAPVYAAVAQSPTPGADGLPTLGPAAQTTLTAVKAYELRVAAADAACKPPLDRVVETVEADASAEWVEENGPIAEVIAGGTGG